MVRKYCRLFFLADTCQDSPRDWVQHQDCLLRNIIQGIITRSLIWIHVFPWTGWNLATGDNSAHSMWWKGKSSEAEAGSRSVAEISFWQISVKYFSLISCLLNEFICLFPYHSLGFRIQACPQTSQEENNPCHKLQHIHTSWASTQWKELMLL